MDSHSETYPTAASPGKKPLRFRIGVGLLILNLLMWAFAPIVPFLPMDAGTKAAVVAIDLATAEAVWLLGIALVGKEAYQSIRNRFRRKRGRPETAEGVETG